MAVTLKPLTRWRVAVGVAFLVMVVGSTLSRRPAYRPPKFIGLRDLLAEKAARERDEDLRMWGRMMEFGGAGVLGGIGIAPWLLARGCARCSGRRVGRFCAACGERQTA